MNQPVPQPPARHPIASVPPAQRPTRSRTEIRIKSVELAVQLIATGAQGAGRDVFALASQIEFWVTGGER